MNASMVHLVFGCDRNVVDGLATVIASAAHHLRASSELHVHVVDCGIGEDVRQQLTAAVAERLKNTRIEFIDLPAERLQHFPRPAALSHVTPAAYSRLFLHELLPAIDRIIYLDCDLLVTADLQELQSLDLGEKLMAAAVDTVIPSLGHERESLVANLPELSPQQPYFNSGVLLLDLQKFREVDATALYAAAMQKVEARYADQSIFNAVFQGRWRELAPSWNRQTLLGRDFSVFPDRSRAIWHFSSKLKPWHFHRARSRGLLRQWQREQDAIGWTPTFQPTIGAKPSLIRDLLKQARSWNDCRKSERSIAPLPVTQG
jgi:lipopolysaccharide biosynthesis glycosyltransferase